MRATHEIHNSEIKSMMSCRRRWDLAYRQGWKTPTNPTYFEFGSAYHRGMEAFYDPHRWKSTSVEEKLERAEGAFSRTVALQKAEYLEVTNEPRLDREEQDIYDQQADLGLAMLRYYAERVHPTEDIWWEPIATEIPFSVPLMDPDTGFTRGLVCVNSPDCGQSHYQGAPVTFDGTADVLMRDLEYGGLWVGDVKTAGQLSTEEEYLQMDDQVNGYTMALRLGLGLDIRGFLYMEHRKDVPRPPRELTKPNKEGCLYSTDRRQLTDYQTVIETVQEQDKLAFDSGCYEDYLEYLQSRQAPRFHQRFDIGKSITQMESARMSLAVRAREMVRSDVAIYPEPAKFSCERCQYYDPCMGMEMGEDVNFTLNSLYEKAGL